MTEVDWLGATDSMPVLEFLKDKASERKQWLFICACDWRYREQTALGSKEHILIMERYVDFHINQDVFCQYWEELSPGLLDSNKRNIRD